MRRNIQKGILRISAVLYCIALIVFMMWLVHDVDKVTLGQWILIGIIGLFAGLPATRALISWVLDPFVRDDDLEKD